MVTSERPHAAAVTAAYLQEISWPEGALRRLADDHWGLTVEAGGWALDVGLAVREDVLRAQAQVLPAGLADPHDLLHRNRLLRLVRYSHADDGSVWAEGDAPADGLSAATVDRLLGALVEAAGAIRAPYAARRRERSRYIA